MAKPAPRPRPPASTVGLGAAGWIAALLAALALVVWDATRNVRHYDRASAQYGVAVHAPAVDAASPTGFADGRRTIVYPSRWVDAQQWIMQAQRTIATGEWRLREVETDNAPSGRPVHWGSLFRWWLEAWAFIVHAVTGQPLGSAAERAALLANPALLVVLLLALVPWVARRFGASAGAFLALAMVGSPPFYVLFAAENPDHHGLIQVCMMVLLIAVLSGGGGWTRNEKETVPGAWAWLPTVAHARRAFGVAGFAGGIGLWVSAVGTIPVFVGVALGALWSAWLGRRAPSFSRFEPALWRRWGAIGGATALGCYLLEYFPAHLGWRFEVNHPIYALAWLGAGEVLAQATSWLSGVHRMPDRASWLRLAGGLVAIAVPVVTIAGWGERVFAVSDIFLWSMSHDYTPEGQGLWRTMRLAGFGAATIASCLPMLLMVLVAAWFFRARASALARAVIAVPFAATALFWLMALKELRWWSVGYGLLFVVVIGLAALVRAADLKRWQRAACWLVGFALFAPGLVDAVHTVQKKALTADDFFSLVERDLAHGLRQRVGGGPLVILSAPSTTSRMIYFGGAKGLGTPYWENLAGQKRAAAIFAAKTTDEAEALVRAAGVTHIVLLSWDDFIEAYVRLARGLSLQDPITEPAFGFELLRSSLPPPWLRRLPDHLPDLPLFRKEGILIFEITDRTRPEQALVRAARDRLYRGQLAAARELIPQLEQNSGDLAAQVTLARVHVAAQNTAGFASALERAIQLLPQVSDLEPEEHVDLIAVFALAGRATEARAQMTALMRVLDAASLRQLTPGALKNLLGLAQRLGVAWTDPSLRELAMKLLPPDGRL